MAAHMHMTGAGPERRSAPEDDMVKAHMSVADDGDAPSDSDPRSDRDEDPIDEQNWQEDVADRRRGNQPQVGRTGARFGGSRRQPKVGRTGARFGPAADHRPQQDTARDVGRTGARFRSADADARAPEQPELTSPQQGDRPATAPYPLAPRPDADDGRYGADEDGADEDGAGWTAADWDEPGSVGGDGDGADVPSWVRPYTWTAGRTSTAYDLAVETLLSTSERGIRLLAFGSPRFEHRVVADLCGQPRSVAEVAALLSMPLGVARVLLSDMAALGIVTVHATASAADGQPDLALMERVLSGLRQL